MFKRKRYLKMLMSLLLVALVAPPVHAETLTVADGTVQNNNVPISGNNATNNRYVEVIYPSTMLEDLNGGLINAVKFYCKSNNYLYNKKYTIEVGESTTQSSFGDAINSGLTVVATDVNLAAGITEFEINFTTPYNYHGGNLVVKLTQTAAGFTDKSVFYGITQAGAAYTSWPISNTYVQNFMPKTTFTYEPGTLAEYDAKVNPSSLNFGEIRVGSEETKNITLKNSGANAFTPTLTFPTGYSTTWTPVSIASGEAVTIPVIFNPADVGEYNGTLIIDCTNGIVKEVSITGSATKSITVAEEPSTSNSNVPVYASWYDRNQHNQIIYPASLLTDLIGKRINAVTFFPSSTVGFYGGNIAIRLTTSETQSSFSSANYVTEIPETPFGSIVPASSSETLAITCDEGQEFLYTGGNLIVDILTTTYTSGEGYYSTSTSFKGISQTGGSLYAYSSTSGVNGSSFSPTVANFLPMVKFNYEDAEAGVYVTPAELSFGGEDFVCGNGNTDAKTFKVTNTTEAAVNLVLDDSNNIFTIEPTTIEAGAINAEVTVTYAPTAAGTHNATVTVDDKIVTLTGTAVEPNIKGTVTPTELTFSCVEGKTATGTVTVANTGNTAFTPVFTTAAPFSIEAAVDVEIAAGASKEFTVTYAPEAVGKHTATLNVSINGALTEVALNGTATEAPKEVNVAENGTATSYHIPITGNFFDNDNDFGQTIYSKNDLGLLANKNITKVKYYSDEAIEAKLADIELEIYLMETPLDEIEYNDNTYKYVPFEFSGSANGTYIISGNEGKELEFNLSTPFAYSGNNNLVVQLKVKTKGSYQNIPWLGKNVDKTIGYYAYSTSTTGHESFLPKTTFVYEEAPATEIATLKDLINEGVSGSKYTIQEELLGVYMQGQSVWFKDANGSAIDFQTPGAEKVYWINNVSTKDFDQSNWIEVDFTNVEIPEDVKGEEPNVKIQNLTGIFTNENGNPKLVLTETPAEVTALSDPAQAYVPNVYIPAHFEGTHQGYFFSYPKAQEYAKFAKAQWNGSNMVMTSNTEYNPEGLTGSFTIKPVDGLDAETHVGEFYEFHGIIRKVGRTTPAPRIKAEGDSYEVEATDLNPESTVTAINTIGINGNVKSVKYVNVAGLVSDRPFEGVNIVVTEYTDGSRTTTKMVR